MRTKQSGRSKTTWRGRIEDGFESWGHFVCRHAWAALIFSALVTVWLGSLIPGLTIDNSTESLLLPDDPAVIQYNQARDLFGRDDQILIAVKAPDLFAADFLERLRDLHETLEAEVPYLEEVDSLLTARVTKGKADELIVEELFERWPETTEDRERLRADAYENPLYRNMLISADHKMTAVVIKPVTYSQTSQTAAAEDEASDDFSGFGETEGAPAVYLTAAEITELMAALDDVIGRFEAEDFQLHVAGGVVMTDRITRRMNRDMAVMFPLAGGMMCIVLALLFRRIGGIVLPPAVVGLSLLATIGTMVWIGIPGSSAVQILPVFLLTVGVCDAVHILTLVYRFRAQGDDQEKAISRAVGHSGLAVLMTSLTTAAGMASFTTAKMAAIQHLGILAPIGVGMAFVYTLVLLPALLMIFPLRTPRARKGATTPLPFENQLVAAGLFAARHPVRILVPTFVLLVFCVLGAFQLRFSHNGLSWFPRTDRVVSDFQAIDETMKGSVSVDLVIDTGKAGGLYDPETLASIDAFQEQARHLPVEPLFIEKTLSLIDIVKETHLALNENREGLRRIPETRDAVAQELLLFEQSGSEDTEELVDSEYRLARMSLWVPFEDALIYPPLLRSLRTLAEETLAPGVEFRITGMMTLLAEVFDAVIKSMMRSYIFAFAVITPLMMLLLGSLRRGLVSMVPNFLPVLCVVGVCGWFDIALDSTTMIVGAMVIGIAVDDTIHFMHKFHRNFEATGDVEAAVQETLRTTGSALMFTTLVLMIGFIVFEFAAMKNMRIFGGLATMATAVAFMADIFVAPALLAVVEGLRRRSEPVV